MFGKLTFLSILFASFASQASPLLTLMTSAETLLQEDTRADLKQLDHFFEARGFTVLRGDGSGPLTPLNWTHRIYYQQDLKYQVFLKIGAFIKGVDPGQGVDFQDGIVLNHVGVVPSILYFQGFNEQKMKRFQTELGQLPVLKRPTKTSLLLQMVLPSARADSLCARDPDYSSPVKENSPQQNSTLATIAKVSMACIKGVGFGVWDSTGGMVLDVAKLGWSGVKGTLNCAGSLVFEGGKYCADVGAKALVGAKKAFDGLLNVTNNFNSVMSNAYDGFRQLDPELKGKILCELASSLGTAALMTFLTAGAGSPVFLAKLAEAVAKVKTMTQSAKLGSGLDRLAGALKAKSAASAEFFSAMRTGPEDVQKAFLAFDKAANLAKSAAKNRSDFAKQLEWIYTPSKMKKLDSELGGWSRYETDMKEYQRLVQLEKNFNERAQKALDVHSKALRDSNMAEGTKLKLLAGSASYLGMVSCSTMNQVHSIPDPVQGKTGAR
jgi:hypothetical protein